MPGMRASAAIAFSALLSLAACDGAGEHRNADAVQPDSAQQPVTGPEAASQGTRIQNAPPPAGTTGPTPPDGNPSTTTPNDPSQPASAAASGGVENGAAPAPGGTQPQQP